VSKSSGVKAHSAVIEVINELTPDEEQERHRLELRVEKAFTEACFALRSLRDKKLYRSTHSTFENYVLERFGMKRAHAYRLINAAAVVENLSPIGDILPTNESQCRYLATLSEPVVQRKAWRQILKDKDGQIPTTKDVRSIVERLKEKPLIRATDFCQVGDVFDLTRLEGAERKYNGCWAIASGMKNFTVVVDVHDTTLTVKPENLNSIDDPDVRCQLPQILKRIRRLRECGLLDRCAYTVLESLGRQTYLTPVEEGLLQWLENHYGVVSTED